MAIEAFIKAAETAKEVIKETEKVRAFDARKPIEASSIGVKKVDALSKIDIDKRIKSDLVTGSKIIKEINGYKYTLDKKGRTIHAEGELRIDPAERNKNAQRRAGGKDRLNSDDGGHLIGNQFGGVGEKNLVAQDSVLNKGVYNRLETKWANAVKNGDKVYVKISPKYHGNSVRPDSFKVDYSINGERFKASFSNKPNAYAK